MTADGTAFPPGSGYDLADFQGIPTGIAPGGNGPVIENPALAVEPDPYVDANGTTVTVDEFLSYGTYSQDNSYNTLEIPCAGVAGPCDTNLAVLINNNLEGAGNPLGLENPGGASLLESSESYIVFATGTGGNAQTGPRPRPMYFQPTSPRLPPMLTSRHAR